MIGTFAFGEAPFCVDDATLFVVQNVDGTATISVGASATALRFRFVSGSADISTTAVGIALKMLFVSGAASVTVTATSASDRIRLVSTAVTAASAFSRIRGLDATAQIVTTATGDFVGIFVVAGAVNIALNQSTVANILGDAWTIVPEGSETWTIQPSSGSWSVQAEGSETWSIVPVGNETWTPVNNDSIRRMATRSAAAR